MTSAPTNANPALSNTLTGYDPTGHQEGVAIQVGTLVQDATTGVWYAPVQTTGGGGGVQYTDAGTPPANPIGTALIFDNSGAWVDVGADHPLPISGTFWQTTQPVSVSTLPSATGANTVANSLPITNAAVQGWIAATGTGTSGQDDSFTFASQVRKVVLYNASANPVPFEFDTVSTATSIPIQPGQYMVFDDVLCTVVHVFPSATLPLNTTSGLYVKGWK